MAAAVATRANSVVAVVHLQNDEAQVRVVVMAAAAVCLMVPVQ